MKFAVVTPIPTPYRDPFWNVVAEHSGVGELDVFYCAQGKSDRPWKADWEMLYRAEFLPGRNLLNWKGADASCFWNPSIRSELRKGCYDAVLIGGYNHVTMLAAMREAVRLDVPFFLMCETWFSRQGTGWFREAIKARLLRWIITHAAGFLPTGIRAEAYLKKYGADSDRLARLPNVPDIAAFSGARGAVKSVPEELLSDSGRCVVLFAARMIPKKRPDLLVRAFADTADEHDAVLVMVGDGPLRLQVERLAAELGLHERVVFAGFAEPGQMPAWYARADLYVLPSSETWGVSVLEALASGTPVLISDEVGCGPDVLIDDGCGSVIPAGDREQLGTAIREQVNQCYNRQLMPVPVEKLEEEFGYTAVAERLVGILRRE